jgi:cell division septum initiation protein DivIVA
MAEEKKEILEASSPVDGNHGAEAMLEMILNKEDEISRRMKEAEAEAEHVVEEAKLDAAAMKREATSADIGREMRERELEKASREAKRAASETEEAARRIRAYGEEHIERAVKVVIDGVLPPIQSGE